MPTPIPQTKRKGLTAKTKKVLTGKKKPSQGPTLPMNDPDPGSRVTGDENQATSDD